MEKSKTTMPVPPPEPKRKHKRWGKKSRPLAADPLDKLIIEGAAPDAPMRKPEVRKTQAKTFMLGEQQADIVGKASKAIGLSQYIRNLIRKDVEESGETWPEHEVQGR